MSKVSSSKFHHRTQCSADAWILALLWKLPQMQSCSTNNGNLDKNNLTFYKIDCCAATHGRMWMNNIPNESRIIMLSCTDISCCCFFLGGELRVNPGFPFFFYSHCIASKVFWKYKIATPNIRRQFWTYLK